MGRERSETVEHRKHPVRNFFYFLYTLLNAFAFCTLFYALNKADYTLAVGAGAIVAIAVLVGVIDALIPKRRR